MGYSIENKQPLAFEAVLSTSEHYFTVSKTKDLVLAAEQDTKTSPEVYFQIED